MTRANEAPRSKRASWITAWFAIDAIVALAPPIYWAADGGMTPILGLPAAVFYFVAVAVCITGSIVAAYAAEARTGEAV
jgi:hypothetical protein